MKKGFTLIELLAVIIILAVIALIATPAVLNVVENAKKEANKNSANGLLEGARLYYIESLLDENNIDPSTDLMDEIKVSGKKPDSGSIYVNKNGETALAVVYDDVCYIKDFTDAQLTEFEDINNCNIVNELVAYYEFGEPTTLSTTNYQDVIALTKSNVFIKKENEQLYVCVYRNNNLECFKNNYELEEEHVFTEFGEENCTTYEYGINCFDKENQIAFLLLYDGTISLESPNGGCIIDQNNIPTCLKSE